MHSYQGKTKSELTFAKGDVFIVNGKTESGWAAAEIRGQIGYVPFSYVKPVQGC